MNNINIIYEFVRQGVFAGMQEVSAREKKNQTHTYTHNIYTYIYIGKLLRLLHAAHIHWIWQAYSNGDMFMYGTCVSAAIAYHSHA